MGDEGRRRACHSGVGRGAEPRRAGRGRCVVSDEVGDSARSSLAVPLIPLSAAPQFLAPPPAPIEQASGLERRGRGLAVRLLHQG